MTKEPKTGRNSAPSFLEHIARSRSRAHVESTKQLENGPYHPSEELLRQYVLAELDKSDTEIVMEHLSLCGLCSRKALKISWELNETEPLIERVRAFVSSLSFPVSFFPEAGFVRSGISMEEKRSYVSGTDMILSLEAPDDGYVVIFYGCEETGEVKLVFPREPADTPHRAAGEQLAPITGTVTGPPGKHFIKVFWTRISLLDPRDLNLRDEKVRATAVANFFEALEDLDENDWRSATTEYEVIAE